MQIEVRFKGEKYKGRKLMVESPDAYQLANIVQDSLTGHGIKFEVVKPGPRGRPKKVKDETQTVQA